MKFTVLFLVSHRVKEPITGNVFIKPKGTLKKKSQILQFSELHHIGTFSFRMSSCVHTVMVTVEEKVSFY